MSGVTLDAGALIAHERGSRAVELAFAREAVGGVAIPAGVLAQVYRDGGRQARLMRMLGSAKTEIVPLDRAVALQVGRVCAATGVNDVVDASVVLCARLRRHVVLTSDADDLRRIDPGLRIVEV